MNGNGSKGLPKDWVEASIGEITDLVYRYPTYFGITYVDEGVPEVRGELLLDNGEIESDASKFRFITDETAKKFPKVRLNSGDIVMSVRGTMGKIGIVREQLKGAVITANLIRLSPRRELLLPDFFRLALLTPEFGRALNGASPQTTIKTITAFALKELKFAIPKSIEEQRKIAAVLGLAQRAIEQQERLTALTTELKKALLHKLFTEGLRGEPQKQTEIGPVPESWEVTTLGSCCDIVSGSLSYTDFSKIASSDALDAVDCMGVKVSDMNLAGNGSRFVAANLTKRLPPDFARKKLVPANAVVFPKRGAAIATNKKRLTTTWTVLDPNLIGLCAKDTLDPEFLFHWWQTFDLRKITDPGPTPQLNKKDLVPILMPLPRDVEEQGEIAAAISVLDSKIGCHRQKHVALTELFRTMLHQLMTVQIRVNDVDLTNLEGEIGNA